MTGVTAPRAVPSRWGRYPPLASVSVVMLLILAVLPSALNLPQSNPTETLEYAPVPPDDQAPPSMSGNLASLGLAGGATLTESATVPPESAAADTGGPGDLDGTSSSGVGFRPPATKRCVGSPPRQTADPLSPPCVGYFEGDNFGATYSGVTRDEVRVLMYVAGGGNCGTSQGCPTPPQRRYYDLAQPPAEGEEEYFVVQHLRNWQRYFNERYQAYGRFVHFYVYFPSVTGTVEERRADAAENVQRIKPFAVTFARGGTNLDAYQEVVAKRGVLTFGSLFGLAADDYRRFPKLTWGYLPSIEQQASNFASYLCRRINGRPVTFSGNPADSGQPRKFGLLYTTELRWPNNRKFKDAVKAEAARCGLEFAIERAHPSSGYQVDSRYAPDYAAEAMAEFRRAGVTTVVWPLGYETNFSKAAAAIGYRPEWVIAGDLYQDGILGASAQDQTVWRHALVVSILTHYGANQVSRPCDEAYTEVDPDVPRETLDLAYACLLYEPLRQLFTGIQVAGPRLGPTSIDNGFHAIPAVASTDPAVPACFYAANDYTCVKDAVVTRWDPEGRGPETNGARGCYRLLDRGRRYFAEGWPAENEDASIQPADPCNGYLGGVFTA